MPVNASSEIFARNEDLGYRVWSKGKWYEAQPIGPDGQSTATDGWIIFDSNARGVLIASIQQPAGSAAFAKYAILTPTDLDVAIAVKPTSLKVTEEFDVQLTIRNQMDIPLTQVGIVVPSMYLTGGAVVDWVKAPPALLNLAPGASGVLHYGYRAKGSGKVQVRFQIEGLDAGGVRQTLTESFATPEVTVVGPKADLMARGASEPDAALHGRGVMQTVAAGEQIVYLPVAADGRSEFAVRLENPDSTTNRYVLRAFTNGPPNWELHVKAAGVDITAAVYSPAGWKPPAFKPGDALSMEASLAPGPKAATRETKTLALRVYDDSTDISVLDVVQLRATLVPVPVAVSLHAMSKDGLTPASIGAGTSDIDAPLVPVTDPAVLSKQPVVAGGLVADGVTPLVLELRADPALLAQFKDGRDFDLDLSAASGGGLKDTTTLKQLRVLTNGQWTATTRIRLRQDAPVAWAAIVPIASDVLVFTENHPEIRLRLSVAETLTTDVAGTKEFGLRKPPIALVHGYCTTGEWGDEVKAILGTSRPLGVEGSPNNFVRTIRYGQDVLPDIATTLGAAVYVNTAWSLRRCAVLALTAWWISTACWPTPRRIR